MSSVVTDWDNDYARIARAAAQLRATANSPFHSRQRESSASQAINRESILTGLNRLTTRLGNIERSSRSSLNEKELARRRALVQNLSAQLADFSSANTNTNTTNTQDFGHNNGNGATMTTTMDPSSFQEGQQPRQSTAVMAMREQDNMLDELASGVGRLKDQSKMINEESKMHVHLLNQMDEDVEKAQVGMETETKRALQLKEDRSVWRLYMIIAGLSILLFILILSGLS